MPIDPAVAVGAELPGRDLAWDSTDVLLYHLAVGAGPDELSYVYEEALRGVLPTFATVATTLRDTDPPTVKMPGIDVDLSRVVHGRQELELHSPIPVTGQCRTRARIAAVYDKGTAAVVVTETVTELFTSRISIFAKGEGGFGGDRGPSTRVPVPERAPDAEVLSPTDPRQALWYRLCGDRNPLHIDPAFARRAGFPRPILHGLCTYGFTGRALLHTFCGSEPERLRSMRGRFSKPVLPGDALTINMWETGEGEALYQTRNQHGDVVIDAGRCTFA